MLVFSVLGLAMTLVALALLVTGGYLMALRLLGEEEQRRDPLAVAIASLLAATAQAVGIALALGALGWLRLDLALLAQTVLVAVLARVGRPAAVQATTFDAALLVFRRAWDRLRENAVLAVVAAHAVGSEVLRGLIRPPLSWDSVMYHLLLTATWLQRHDLRPVFGPYPVNVYGFVPANGSLWYWWWMAPSHSELFVNLAALPHWILLGLAAGGVARELGARRHWPLASFLVLLTPTVVRFAATEYVDIFLSACLLSAAFFALRWMDRPRFADALLAGAAGGLAGGAKLFGIPFAAALAAAAFILAPGTAGRFRRRLPQAVAACLVAAAFGSFFYLRNIAAGAGPLALVCEGREEPAKAAPASTGGAAAQLAPNRAQSSPPPPSPPSPAPLAEPRASRPEAVAAAGTPRSPAVHTHRRTSLTTPPAPVVTPPDLPDAAAPAALPAPIARPAATAALLTAPTASAAAGTFSTVASRSAAAITTPAAVAAPPTAPAQPAAAAPAPAAPAALPPPPGPPAPSLLSKLRRWLPKLPRKDSVATIWERPGGGTTVLDAFLGITRQQSVELGAGPQIFVLLLALVTLPFGTAAGRRRAALVAASQILFELVFWVAVPFAANLNIFANVRYLIPAIGLALAGGVAMLEQRGMSDLWLRGIALALACQGMLQLHAEMPRGVRLAIGVMDVGLVALGLSPALRGFLRRRAGACAAAALVLALLLMPVFTRFRIADRGRAYANEWTAHFTSAYVFARGWAWLDENGGDGAVDLVATPGNYFVYPAMGPFLEREVRYVNVNPANLEDAARYPACNPRIAPSQLAWLANFAASGDRWLLLHRYPEFDFPMEAQWAAARPDLFALRYSDPTSLVFEFLPAIAAPRR